jgi:hypothetical protein
MSKRPKPQAAAPAVNMKRCNFFMSIPMTEALAALAGRRGMSSAEVVRQAVRTCLKRNGYDV